MTCYSGYAALGCHMRITIEPDDESTSDIRIFATGHYHGVVVIKTVVHLELELRYRTKRDASALSRKYNAPSSGACEGCEGKARGVQSFGFRASGLRFLWPPG